ncbi:MAG: biotin--[acetyl-CoA-carboxylase] ligase [Pigmentiphaga sp.]|nr:biotin--[acetyl-CoA-carboxylase] ligase [Pigmentiphaga sp.]
MTGTLDSAPAAAPPSALSSAHQEAALRRRLPHWPSVAWVEQSGSTNADLLAALRAGHPTPALLGAHWQSGGRGRAGRSFLTPPGTALTFSCAFQTPLPPAAMPTLSIWLGLAAWTALAELLPPGHALRLKWPNDLQWGEAKLAGILMESTGHRANQPGGLVIGIGINLARGDALSATLQRPVAGWADTEHDATPADLAQAIANQWQAALEIAQRAWRPALGLPFLPAAFAEADVLAGRAIRLLDQGREQAAGTACGIDTFGRLGLAKGEAPPQWLSVGDVSVRPAP